MIGGHLKKDGMIEMAAVGGGGGGGRGWRGGGEESLWLGGVWACP